MHLVVAYLGETKNRRPSAAQSLLETHPGGRREKELEREKIAPTLAGFAWK